MSGSIRVPDLPVLGAPTDDSVVVGDHVGTGLFTLVALRNYVLSSGAADLSVASLTVTNGVNIGGAVAITGNVGVGGTFSVSGDGIFDNNMTVQDNVGIGGALNVTGNTGVGGTFGVSGTTTLSGAVNVVGPGTFNGNLTAAGIITGNSVKASLDGSFALIDDTAAGTRILAWNNQSGQYYNAADDNVTWYSMAGTLMQLTSAGHLLLMGGNTSLGDFNDSYLTLNGGSEFSTGAGGKSSLIINGGGRVPYGFEFYTNGTRLVAFDGAGAAYKPGGGTWADISDARIKQDVQDYASGLAEVVQLRPVTYRFLQETGRDTSKVYTGLIAQEAETVMPEMVRQGPADAGSLHFNDMRSLDTAALIFAVVNALKEVTTRLEALEAAPLTRSRQPDV